MSAKIYPHFSDLDIRYIGPDLDMGPLPSVIYLSISAAESLSLDPYNQPAKVLEKENIRVFSITLPGHGHGFDKTKAMNYWAKHTSELLLFINETKKFVLHLSKHATNIGLMGLSRGGFIATHLAVMPQVRAVLGFAPLTDLAGLSEFENKNFEDALNLKHLYKDLIHKKIRYYIGNRDLRVGTERAFNFIFDLSDYAYHERIRSMSAELFILPSIGLHGHGTLFETFQEGAIWLKKQIVQ